MACILQQRGHVVKSLVFLDGSPFYVAAHTSVHKAKFDKSTNANEEEATVLCFFLMQYIDIDFINVRIFEST